MTQDIFQRLICSEQWIIAQGLPYLKTAQSLKVSPASVLKHDCENRQISLKICPKRARSLEFYSSLHAYVQILSPKQLQNDVGTPYISVCVLFLLFKIIFVTFMVPHNWHILVIVNFKGGEDLENLLLVVFEKQDSNYQGLYWGALKPDE